MIGTELVRKKIKSCGKTLIVTTLTQSPGTFAVVTPAFSIVFHFAGIPLYLAFIFGGIALATAPAPALSIVSEFNTEGPVTKTLRTCLHKKCVRIFEHNFVADKEKMRRRAGARQAFLTQSAAKFAEKTCAYACEDRFSA